MIKSLLAEAPADPSRPFSWRHENGHPLDHVRVKDVESGVNGPHAQFRRKPLEAVGDMAETTCD